MTKRVLVLGVGGMLGNTCFSHFNRIKEFETFGTWRKPGQFRISSFNALSDSIPELIDEIKPDWIINCIGVIKQKIDFNDLESNANTFAINAEFPKTLAESVSSTNIRVIQIATDCVYLGNKGQYFEDSIHDATDLYGKSKSLGEINSNEFLNLRASIIGREITSSFSLTNWFLSQRNSAKIEGFINHKWNGVTALAYSKIIASIIINDKFISGTFHLVPLGEVSKFELLQLFAKYFNRNDIEITPRVANPSIDRTLKTNFPRFNEELWRLAGYKEVPQIEFLVNEFSNYS